MIIKNRNTGEVIFDGDAADLRWADLRWADLSGVSLSGANLRWADLSGADLSGADLSRAYLSRADLSRVNLSGADLSRADLSRVSLSGANLRWANLSGANLRFSIGDGTVIRSMQTEEYHVAICDDYIAIGCKAYRVHEWAGFSDAEILAMDEGALDWWRENKHLVMAFAKAEDFGVDY